MENQNFADDILKNAFSGLNISNQENINKVAEMLDKYGLRWDVKKEPLNLADGIFTGFHAIVRQDNRTTFATCKEGYEPFQNAELAELLIKICDETGYKIHSGGKFNGGGKVYLQIETEQIIKDLGENHTTVNGYITGINSHDLTTNLKWGLSNTTICCMNTFTRVSQELKNSSRHTVNMRVKIDESLRKIELVQKEQQSMFDTFIKLAQVPVTKDHIAKIVSKTTTVDITKSNIDIEKDYSTYARNRTTELLTSISKEMGYKGQTLWGLLSGITHYTTHVMPAPKRENGRIESKYTGGGLAIDNEAYNTILSFR
jgi:phage/plasmid-like protein (TIGR03299 family)